MEDFALERRCRTARGIIYDGRDFLELASAEQITGVGDLSWMRSKTLTFEKNFALPR
jgi:hypothetical protein